MQQPDLTVKPRPNFRLTLGAVTVLSSAAVYLAIKAATFFGLAAGAGVFAFASELAVLGMIMGAGTLAMAYTAKFLMKMILPSLSKTLSEQDIVRYDQQKQTFQDKYGSENFEEFSMKIDDYTVISGFILKTKTKENQNKYILHGRGSAGLIQDELAMNEFIRDYELTGANVIAINYPGVLDSKGAPNTIADIPNSIALFVMRFSKQYGADISNVFLKGHSIGAYFLTWVAHLLSVFPMSFYSGRSLHSLGSQMASSPFLASCIDKLLSVLIEAQDVSKLNMGLNKFQIVGAKEDNVIKPAARRNNNLEFQPESDRVTTYGKTPQQEPAPNDIHNLPLLYFHDTDANMNAELAYLDFVQKQLELVLPEQTSKDIEVSRLRV